ncbi:hypothetical protein DY000_02011514 [Brassica cretica]|uniref:Uncharacterized protein n=1 Tax=Brassica cretica TaxID=69181 RepID=A0ABQ7CZJ1_BRACR|nr:hypothetical protein DY000_02011514 [Brassica cretica]
MIKSIVQLYVDGDDNNDDEPCDEAWQISCMHLISMSHMKKLLFLPPLDVEASKQYKHIVGDTCVLDSPFTLTLGDGSVITAPSLKKTVYLVGALSLSKSIMQLVQGFSGGSKKPFLPNFTPSILLRSLNPTVNRPHSLPLLLFILQVWYGRVRPSK